MREFDLPLIAPQAIVAYLARPLGGYDFLKQVPRAELAAHARELGFRYVTEPRVNQLVCNIIAAQEPRFLFYLDMGAGKTKTILDIIRWRKSRGELQRALVDVPEFSHMDVWEEQIREHAPDLRFVKLLGDKDERFELIDKKADVYIINSPGLPVYMTKLRQAKGGRMKKAVDSDAAAEFASLFNFINLDEIHRVRDHESLTFRLMRWLTTAAPFAYANTGTPHGRDPAMLWPQFQLIDEGETLGSLGLFRAAFFEAKKRRFGKKFAGYDYSFCEERAPQLHRIIKHRSIVYEEHELAADLPPRTYLKRYVRMSPEQRLYYSRITERMKEARGDYSSLDNVFTRYRQLASGFLALKADDDSRIEVDIQPNPKLEAMKEVVLDLPASEKFLIFYHFHHSGTKLRAMLDALGIPWATLYGRQRMIADGVKDYDRQYQRFLEDRRCAAFVLQDQAGSEAINPQTVCRYLWFYERPDDPVISQQAEKRIFRPGQKRPCFIGDLIVRGTCEEKLLDYVKESRDMRKAILSGEEIL